MRGLIAWGILALTGLSLWWTTVKARRLLHRSLGRKLRKDEETSLAPWVHRLFHGMHLEESAP